MVVSSTSTPAQPPRLLAAPPVHAGRLRAAGCRSSSPRAGLSALAAAAQVASALAFFQPRWNMTLFFVMGGALAVAVPAFQLIILRRRHALSGTPIDKPSRTGIDAQLLLGGVLFGAGWGTGGFCPGPALTALAAPQQQSVAMVVCMLAAMAVTQWLLAKRSCAGAAPPKAA